MGRNGHNPRLCALRRGGSNPGAESLEAADVRWMARRCLGPKSARRRLSIFAVVGAADTRRIAVCSPVRSALQMSDESVYTSSSSQLAIWSAPLPQSGVSLPIPPDSRSLSWSPGRSGRL